MCHGGVCLPQHFRRSTAVCGPTAAAAAARRVQVAMDADGTRTSSSASATPPIRNTSKSLIRDPHHRGFDTLLATSQPTQAKWCLRPPEPNLPAPLPNFRGLERPPWKVTRAPFNNSAPLGEGGVPHHPPTPPPSPPTTLPTH